MLHWIPLIDAAVLPFANQSAFSLTRFKVSLMCVCVWAFFCVFLRFLIIHSAKKSINSRGFCVLLAVPDDSSSNPSNGFGRVSMYVDENRCAERNLQLTPHYSNTSKTTYVYSIKCAFLSTAYIVLQAQFQAKEQFSFSFSFDCYLLHILYNFHSHFLFNSLWRWVHFVVVSFLPILSRFTEFLQPPDTFWVRKEQRVDNVGLAKTKQRQKTSRTNA